MMEERASCDKSLLTQEKLSLKSWGLPNKLLEKYSAKGIENMFPWQVECLTCDGVLSGRNLVYSAPTSAGKTMVAEIITIQTVLERKKKVIFILPFVSVVREKMLYFQNLLGSSGVRVEGFMGSHAPPGGLRTVHIAVCTIEKANSLINRLLEDQGLDAIGCVVVDELHLLGDPHRGYLLELLLTKLKYMCRKDKTLNIQVVGMSATLPNLVDLATWLDAALYTTDFRPIPLTEYFKVNSSVYDASTMKLKYNIKPVTKFKSDPGDVIHLCLESLLAGHSVLVFCPTRGWCETSAQQIAAEYRRIGYEKSDIGLAVRGQLDGGAISDVMEQLKRCPAGLDPSLGRSVAFGVAFHHAGLTMDERDIVEGAFRSGVLRVLVATSTLSSGVNLPARRVLIRCPTRNMASDVRGYRQMVGRAGRMGKDTAGESFLICNGSERSVGEQLVRGQLPPVESSLGIGDLSSCLKRAVLEVIASGVVNTSEDVELYTSCTFLASSVADDSDSSLSDPLAACVEYLQANEFIRVSGSSLGPTPLAEACLSASLPPDQGLKLLKELHRARQCFVLETELHVIYQVTPYSVCDQWGELDWLRVLSLWEDLPISMKRVGELVGVEERFLVRAVRGTVNMNNSAQKLSIHRRFYTALALQDLVNEVPLPQVAVKFACSKGVLQSLQQSASTFAGMVTQFTRRLGWSNVELLVSQFGARLQFGAQRELLDLLRLDCLTAVQARALYNSGIQALADLATASVGKVERALARATPFHSEQEGEGQEGVSDKCRIWLVGRCAVSETQAADILVQEARQYLERELGLQSANWGDLNASADSSASEKSLTQSLDTPPNPIGQQIKETGKSAKVEALLIKNGELGNKGNKEEEKPSVSHIERSMSVTNSDGTKSPKGIQLAKTAGQIQSSKKEDEVFVNDDSRNNSVSKNNVGTPINNIVNTKKRGSLDLFDSPEQADSPNHQPNDPIVNIKEQNTNRNSDLIGNLKTSNMFQSNREPVNNEIKMNGLDESHLLIPNPEFNQPSENNLPLEPTSSKRPAFCSDERNHPKMSNLMPHNMPESNENVFVGSPNPTEATNAYLEKLDANLGGESLLEMSSFVPETDEVESECFPKVDLWGSDSRGDSLLLGMSSFIALSEERKRKRSIDNMSDSKRLKVLNPRNTEHLHKTPEVSELQVSKISSTNSNLKPIKTSTPTLSQPFEGSINLDSSFLDHENVDCIKTNNDSNNKDLFAESSENIANNVSSHSLNFCNNDKSPSFELKMSDESTENESFPDYNLNLNSMIFNELDSSSSNYSGKQNTHNSTSRSSGKIQPEFDKPLALDGSENIDSKPNELDRKNNCPGYSTESKVIVIPDQKITVLKSNSLKNDVNKCLFQDSFVIDSKLNALIDLKDTITETSNKNTDTSSPFASNLSLNSQLCNLLDAGNSQKDKDTIRRCDGSYSKQFGNSEFNIDTQICNIIDNVVTSNKNGNNDHKHTNRNAIWTESMEVKDIQNLNLDDETIFGTPTSHQKSILFKKPSRNKTKSKKTTQSTKNESVNVADKKIIQAPVQSPIKTYNVDQEPKTLHDTVFKSGQLLLKDTNHGCHSTRSDKEIKISSHKKAEVVPVKLLETKFQSVTDSFPKVAFEKSFSQESQETEADEIGSSQKPPVTPHKTFRERIQNADSPTVNKGKSQVEVVTVCDAATRREFRSGLLGCKCVSLVLTTRAEETVKGEGRIGARIVNKKSESSYPCCYQGLAVMSAVVCWGNSRVYIVTLNHQNCAANLEVLREMVSRRDLVICSWEAKRTVRHLRQCCHLQCDARLSDPTIAEWLLKPHQHTPTLKQMARSYAVSAPQCSVETGFTALLVWELCFLLKAKLKQSGLYKSYTEVEMPTQQVVAEMEMEGVGWDREYAELLWTATEEKMADLETTLYTLAGKKFNLRSRTDLAKIKKGMKESCEESLEEFNKVLQNWRVLNSLKTRNMSGLLMLEGDRIRGSWDTHTVTGRISMQEPSLQHTPRDISIDDQVFSLRSAFVAEPGNVLVSADFSQLELRLLAHFSQDPGLLETFTRPGDVFTTIAAEWHNVPHDQVGAELRHHTKQLCYGLIYGMGLSTLAEEMGVEEGRAGDMVASFHRSYPGLQAYVSRCVAGCRATASCHVSTLLGRRRYLPDINSHNKPLRAQAERQAVNTTIQGSAADIAKTAMLRVRLAIQHSNLAARLIIHLHDELIYEVAKEDANNFAQILRKKMEGAVALSVPLPVKVKLGPSWGQLELID